MRKINRYLSLIVLGSMLLTVAGCNPTTQLNQQQDAPQKTEQQQDLSTLEKEITVTYQLEGMEEVKPAHLYVSTNDNPFYTYVIEGFKATPAEPGLDQIFYELSPENIMNVEVYDKEVELDYIISNVVKTLQSIGEIKELNPEEVWPGHTSQIEGYWNTTADGFIVNVILVKIEGVYVKFTIHTVEEWESIIPFLVMIENTRVFIED